MGRLSKNLCRCAITGGLVAASSFAAAACSADDAAQTQTAAILPRTEVLSVVVTPTAPGEGDNYGSAGGSVAANQAAEADSQSGRAIADDEVNTAGDNTADEVPESLAFAAASGTRYTLGPTANLGAPARAAAGSFGAMFFAGGHVSALRNSGALGSTELTYWNESNTVVATIHHDLVTAPSADWAAQIDAQVAYLQNEFWSSAVVEQFSATGIDWSASGPSLLILDEANNIELHLASSELVQ